MAAYDPVDTAIDERMIELFKMIVELVWRKKKRAAAASPDDEDLDEALVAQMTDELLIEQYVDEYVELMKTSLNGK